MDADDAVLRSGTPLHVVQLGEGDVDGHGEVTRAMHGSLVITDSAVQENVEKSYQVVGVLEMWEETLEVLENTLPYFFTGARELYKEKYRTVG